jgi:hypothetical protein
METIAARSAEGELPVGPMTGVQGNGAHNGAVPDGVTTNGAPNGAPRNGASPNGASRSEKPGREPMPLTGLTPTSLARRLGPKI